MNALRLRPIISQRIINQTSQFRTKATMASKAFPPRGQSSSFKETWLSDPSTYPIIAIMASGLTFMVGMSFNALFTYKQGVDISPSQRGSVMKTYSPEYRTGVVERLALFRGGVRAEGLGVDHEEWAKQKEAYLQGK